jgi:predicted  nucleic acid-binding Zn-ribbon protein
MSLEVRMTVVEQGLQLVNTVQNANTSGITGNIQDLINVVLVQQKTIEDLGKQILLNQEAVKQETQQREEAFSQLSALYAKSMEENKALNDRVNLLAKELQEARAESTQLKADHNALKNLHENHKHHYEQGRWQNIGWSPLNGSTSSPVK